MSEAAEVARLLDILGNRNRRRIIELLRQKPCFVTEISDTLMLSPKAVIDHLQMMERETILACQMDERRRKYYFLANDILIDVSLKEIRIISGADTESNEKNERLKKSVAMLGRMIRSHDQILANLEEINHDIEIRINDIAHNHKDLFKSEREITVIIALSHESLTMPELEQATSLPKKELVDILKRCERSGIVAQENERFMLRGIHAE
ncbi:MAG: ArsR family transcriptional regulator [Methanoregula sp.]